MSIGKDYGIVGGMNFNWNLVIDFGLISFGMLLATLIRSRVRFFQRYLIPNALTAGFILLPFYNFAAPYFGIESTRLGELVYHLLSISFIAMTLRSSVPTGKKGDHRILATSMAVLSQFGIQALTGLLFTFALFKTVMPGLFPSFGFLLPLGFVQGPGQAYAIGQGWEAFGFAGAGSVGLTFAAIGFIFASFGGVFLINYGIRHKWLKPEFLAGLDTTSVKSGVFPPDRERPVAATMSTESEAIDTMTYHFAFVMFVYLLSYLLLHGITMLLSLAGPLGHDLAVNLWGINFIFSALTAIVVKLVIRRAGINHTIDNKTLTRISGIAVDTMVAAAIAAISLVVVKEYWWPILLLSLIAGSITLVTVPWFCSRIFTDHQFHRTLMIFGVSTGTLPTGLALLRVIDPEFETPVASDYMYASGLTFVFAIPFILSINLPVYSVTSGNPVYFWAAVGVSAIYAILVFIVFILIAKKRAFMKKSKVWLDE